MQFRNGISGIKLICYFEVELKMLKQKICYFKLELELYNKNNKIV